MLDDTRRQIDEPVSTGKNGRCTNKFFMTLPRLRMICNLGTFHLASNGTHPSKNKQWLEHCAWARRQKSSPFDT